MKLLNQFYNNIKAQPLEFVFGVNVFLLVIMGTSVRHVSSTVFAILVLIAIVYIRDWRAGWQKLTMSEKLLLGGFFLYFLSALIAFYNVDDVDKYIKLLERYFRFVLVVPVYLVLKNRNIHVMNYLYAGAVVSGPFILAVAINHYIQDPDSPAQGYYHHIIFGQLAMLNAGMMLVMLIRRSPGRAMQILVIFSILCALTASVLSQARGAWAVFPVYVMLVLYFTFKGKKSYHYYFAGLAALAGIILLVTPVGEVLVKRVDEAVSEVSQFYTEDVYNTSVGARIAMWEIGFDVWKKYPVTGTGPGDFDDEVAGLKKQGLYTSMELHNSLHNIYMQALAGSGLIGLVSLLLAILVLPLKVILDEGSCNKEKRLAGFVLLVTFAVFGLSESWTLRLPPVTVFLVYLVTVLSVEKGRAESQHP